jgi:hypothetical protein
MTRLWNRTSLCRTGQSRTTTSGVSTARAGTGWLNENCFLGLAAALRKVGEQESDYNHALPRLAVASDVDTFSKP